MKMLHIHIVCGLVCALFLVPFLFPDNVEFVGIRNENFRTSNHEDIILNVKIGLWQLILGAWKNGISCHRAFEIQCGQGGLPCWSFWGLRLCVVAAIMLIIAAVLVGCRSGLSKWVTRCGVYAILFALMTIVFTGVIFVDILNRVGDTDVFLDFVCLSIGQGESDCLNELLANCLTFESGYSEGEGRPQGLSISINKSLDFVLLSQILFLFLGILGIIIWCCFLHFVNRVVNSKEDGLGLFSSEKCQRKMLKPRKEDYGSSRREVVMPPKRVMYRKFLPDPNPDVKLLS